MSMNTQQEQNAEEKINTETEDSSVGLESKEHSLGQISGIVIIVAILILGGLYFWEKQYFGGDTANTEQTPQEITEGVDPVADNLKQQGTSDDLNSIEKDLGTTDLSNIDEDLSNIDSIFVQ